MTPLFLRPRWLLAHAVVLTIAVVFVALGLWQLRRLDERRSYNATLTARSSLPVVDVQTLLDDRSCGDQRAIGEAMYRRVRASGRYLLSEEVLLLSRTRNTLAGHHLLTPLHVADGCALVVQRGWVPFKTYDPPVPEALPPAGEVTVTGILFPSQRRGRFGPRDLPGEQDGLWRIDLPRLQRQTEARLYPLYLHLQSQDPAQEGDLPKSVALPRPQEGPHLSYALQWFAFAATALVGYAVLARKASRSRDQGADTLVAAEAGKGER